MNKKTFIQIAVILICLGASALVLYNGLFKKDESGSSTVVPASAVPIGVSTQKGQEVPVVNPLPYGDNLSGELKRALKRNGLTYGSIAYPKLDSSEVGILPTDLVKPVPVPKK